VQPDGKSIQYGASWAAHVRKKLGLNLSSEKDAEGVRLYRILER